MNPATITYAEDRTLPGKICIHDSPVPDNRTWCRMALMGVEQVEAAPGGLP